MYIRFVVNELDEDSGRRKGLFQVLLELDDEGELNDYERATFREIYQWFLDNLKEPMSFSRSNKYHAKNVALSWFKGNAQRHIAKMRQLAQILDAKGVVVETIKSEKPGYIVYEDNYQIAAEPFSETDT